MLRVRTNEAVLHFPLNAMMAHAGTTLPLNYYTSTLAYFRITLHGASVAAALQFSPSVVLFLMCGKSESATMWWPAAAQFILSFVKIGQNVQKFKGRRRLRHK